MATLTPGAAASGLHKYFVKLTHEITGGQAKLATGGGRTPLQLLADAVEGLVDEVDLWHEGKRVSQGRRQMVWSTGRRRPASGRLVPHPWDPRSRSPGIR